MDCDMIEKISEYQLLELFDDISIADNISGPITYTICVQSKGQSFSSSNFCPHYDNQTYNRFCTYCPAYGYSGCLPLSSNYYSPGCPNNATVCHAAGLLDIYCD